MPLFDQSQIATQEIQKLIANDSFHPQTLRKYLEALKALPPDKTEVNIDGQVVYLNRIFYDLDKFIKLLSLPFQQSLARYGLTSDYFKEPHLPLPPEILTILDQTIVEIAGLTSNLSSEALAKEEAQKILTASNIPANLKELVAQAAAAQKASEIVKQPYDLKSQIARAQKINIYAQQLRVNTTGRLFHLLQESSYVHDLQKIYGRDNVNRVLWNQIDSSAQQTITSLVINQKALTDPQQAVAYFTRQLSKELQNSEVLRTALAKTDRQSKKAVTETIKNESQKVLENIQPDAQEFHQIQKTAPLTKESARSAAIEVVQSSAQTVQNLSPSEAPFIGAKEGARLVQELAKNAANPEIQIKIIKKSFPKIPPVRIPPFHATIQPAIHHLAGLPAKPDTLAHFILVNRAFFPPVLVAKLTAGLQATPSEQAVVLEIAARLNISPDIAYIYRAGLNPQTLPIITSRLTRQPELSARLVPIQPHLQTIQRSILPESTVLDPSLARQYSRPAESASRALRFQEFLRPVNLISQINHLTIHPFIRSSFISSLRVRSAPFNFVFNAFESVSTGLRSLPSIISSPFRATGNFFNQKLISPVKTWVGNQARAGITKVGAWIAKTGAGKAAKALAIKLGGSLLGKGAAALLANAVPVIGQIAAAASLLSMAGDLAKLAWNNRDTILKVGLGLFSGGLILLSKLLTALGTAAWGLAGGVIGGAIGWIVGGPVGMGIGVAGGTTIGLWIGSGGLSSALTAAGAWLGNAAIGVSNFIAGISVPVSGSAIATIANWTVIGSLTAVTGFTIIQDIQQKTALLAPSGSASSGVCDLQLDNDTFSAISDRADTISSRLVTGFWNYFNHSPLDYPELFDEDKFKLNPNPQYPYDELNMFWCTWLVIKSYHESGFNIALNLNSQSMKDDFYNRSRFLNSDVDYQCIKPGYVVFFRVLNQPTSFRINHTAIVKTVSPEGIVYVQSNAPDRSGTISLSENGVIQNFPDILIEGFGQP